MPDLDQIFAAPKYDPTNPLRNTYEGRINRSVGSVDNPVQVTIDNLDGGQHEYERCYWTPRVDDAGDLVYPIRGDKCLVAISDEEEAWVLVWWPS